MASAAQQVLLSPAELAYLHSSLSLKPPIRPDGRKPNQFRPLTAETGILPGTNGSARVCFADGTEAIVGVKAEIEKTIDFTNAAGEDDREELTSARRDEEEGDEEDARGSKLTGRAEWLEMTIDIPGFRDDEGTTVFLASMLSEALCADGELGSKLVINRRFHWKLYLDILLISPPLSYPLPLLSLTTHLALLATRVPKLKSEGDEDPMFNDDWEESVHLYPSDEGATGSRPPITLLVIGVGGNIIFDPAKEELAVAESALAVSVAETKGPKSAGGPQQQGSGMDLDTPGRDLKLLGIRTIDPPSRLTAPGVPNSANVATAMAGPGATPSKQQQQQVAPMPGTQPIEGVWRPPLGGTKLAMLDMMIAKVLEKGGIADEVLDGIDGVDLS